MKGKQKTVSTLKAEKIFKNVKASLFMEDLVLSQQEEELVKGYLQGSISEKEILKVINM